MKNIMTALALVSLSLIVYLFVCSSLFAQEVAVYYDQAKGNAWIDPGQLVPAIEKAFKAKGIKYSITDAETLAAYMGANKEGIVVMTMGIAPAEIFKNQGEKDLVRQWLFDGGVMFWTGDWPFYYWDTPANCPAAQGEVSVFGASVTQSSGPPGAAMEPTELGKKLIPSIKASPSSRPVSLALLNSSRFEFESYSDNKSVADPIAFRAPKMNGWFVNFHTWPENITLDQVAVEMAELILNRFQVTKAVDNTGKLSTRWGGIKGIY